MADDWETEKGAPVSAMMLDQPEIKLFGRWSSTEVQISDISLQVSRWC